MKKTLFPLLLTICSFVFAQHDLKSLDYFIGNWQGVESGVAGNGIGFRSYRYELGNHFIFVENLSTFPKSEEKPIGEVHRDKGVFSFNGNTQKLMLREFFIEGFTNIYELNETESSENQLVFITREIENNPGNWKAKLILTQDSDNQFTEEFLMAMDGENFQPFIKNVWHKVK